MKIGVISDIHGNKVALEAVLADMPDVETLVCLGDVIGYNPWPAECVERVRAEADVVVKGNHEKMVETPERYRHHAMAYAGFKRAHETLSDEQFEWLRTLPRETTIADDRYLAVHSHPDPEYEDTYVKPDMFSGMAPYVEEYDGLFMGHTHLQHSEWVAGACVLNPGSVGQPRDENPKAAYAVVDAEAQTAELRRVAYDIDRVQQKVAELDMPLRTGKRLAEGK